MRRRGGLSLAEALVTLAALALLSGMVAQVFRASGTFQARTQVGGRNAEALSLGLLSIVRELPEALPVYTLNGGIYEPVGGPPAEAVLQPLPGRVTDRLEFTEMDPGRVGPLQLDLFVATDPSFYRQVALFAAGDALLREVRPFDGSRFVAREPARPVTRVPGATLTLTVQAVTGVAYVTGTAYRVSLKATQPGIPDQESSAYVHLRPKN